jgi:MoxR-like ATPase
VEIAEVSRDHPDVALGASPRAALSMMKCARARAVLKGRHYFTHEDVQAVAFGVLGHRLILRPESEIEGREVGTIVKEILSEVRVLDTD